ncbi:synaptic vesicle glycoprotein 2B-like [Brienomyrus brachyistius]|uniref:synaptic vesicle glycoprotein 2B-like n=1 Tax=Brienomyrus brachyistius TaxID=42636 RepID=UPI0020B3A854|nr:synaptic vesicle glycoprotein 2B-like [Brienomyrus brachyistius]
MGDPYQDNAYLQDSSYSTYGGGTQAGYAYQEDYPRQDEDAASDATEGRDDEDQMYEGEYQGIPHPDDAKAAQRAARAKGPSDEEDTLPEEYESIIEDCGHGRFQWTLFVVAGLALMADGVECFAVGFVLPSAEKDMCLSNANKGMLGLIVYLGMMVGAFVWGGLADKLGRRRCLVSALNMHFAFAFLSSFAQGYGSFLFLRLFSGIGIGGSIPIVFSYFSEFLAMDKRGEHLGWLCMFWMMGGIYASFLAWGIIPHYGWGFSMGTEFQYHSWRIFVLVCALPTLLSLTGLMFMPESPRFLLENGKHDEAWMILKRVHDTNWRAKGEPERVFTVSQIKTARQEGEFTEIQSSTGSAFQRWTVRSKGLTKEVLQNIRSLVSPNLRHGTFFMAIIWFTMAFSYYGLSVWFPDMIKHLQNEEYESKVKIFHKERVKNFVFNFSLENQIHKDGEYISNNFTKMEMTSIKFEDSLFENCYFEDIKSTGTFFKNCTFKSTVFYNTDLWIEKFIDCKMQNTTFVHSKKGCHLNFHEENDILIYLVSFLGSLAVLPGNIISALFMDKVGRIKMIGGSMLISAGCTFFLFMSFSQAAIIAWQCLFCGVSVAAWNGIEVITVELFPASKRTTAFGLLNALCKLAAILGSSIFASFVGITKVIPILLSFGALVGGGLLALKLPETRQKVLL